MGASFAVGLVCLLGFACVCVWEQVQRYACTPGCVCDDVLGFVGLLWRGVVWCWGKVQCGVVVVWRLRRWLLLASALAALLFACERARQHI